MPFPVNGIILPSRGAAATEIGASLLTEMQWMPDKDSGKWLSSRQSMSLSGRTRTQASDNLFRQDKYSGKWLSSRQSMSLSGRTRTQASGISFRQALSLSGRTRTQKVAFFQARFLYFRQDKNSGK